MSNRLEREFPEVAWQAVPPIGARGLPLEVVRGYLARGRELRSRAVRQSVRSGFGVIAWARTWRQGGRGRAAERSDVAAR